ncbi:MAG: hypothetical protein CYG59_16170 [Chloroflexi bacterium]|nr:MAG: hypothetical protein CYG59_16170 [Chloroflexota bacterium]
MTIVVVACAVVLCLVVQRRRAQLLAAHLPAYSVVLSMVGCGVETIGFRLSGSASSAALTVAMACLCGAAYGLRRWPGGWLLIAGIACNGLMMAIHGRMPITPAVLQHVGIASPAGTVLPGSKDIVAEGWLATWGGDRFVTVVPFTDLTSVWSIGDVLLIAGVLRAVTGPVHGLALPCSSRRAAA